MATPERAFLDANVLRGQLTNDVVLSAAHAGAFRPRWTQEVLDEMRRNRPPGVSEAQIDRRIATMNRAFPDAMVTGHEGLIPQMRADEKDKHVLAGAVHSQSGVLVTENTKDFNPPASGPTAMRVERTSVFLNRMLDERPNEVRAGLEEMVGRNRREPQTMPQLIDTMVNQQDLAEFAQKLNTMVPEGERGTDPRLAGPERSASSVAMDGVAHPRGAATPPEAAPGGEQKQPGQGPDRGPTREV